MGKTRDVREAVEKELSYDPLVDATDISVKNINGEVALTGTVPSYPRYLESGPGGVAVRRVTRLHDHRRGRLVFPLGLTRATAVATSLAPYGSHDRPGCRAARAHIAVLFPGFLVKA